MADEKGGASLLICSMSGTQVILSVVPSAGYQFDHWSGDASGTSPIVTVAVNSDKRITAHFKTRTSEPEHLRQQDFKGEPGVGRQQERDGKWVLKQ